MFAWFVNKHYLCNAIENERSQIEYIAEWSSW